MIAIISSNTVIQSSIQNVLQTAFVLNSLFSFSKCVCVAVLWEDIHIAQTL